MSARESEDPTNDQQGWTDSSDSVIIEDDGPWDKTVCPRPPNVPRYYPGREPPEGHPAAKPPVKPPPSPEGE